MLTLGGLLLKISRTVIGEEVSSAQVNRGLAISILVRAGLFLAGLVGMIVVASYLNIENVFGFRQQPVMFGLDGQKPADTYATLVLFGATLLLVPVVRWLKLRWDAMVGIWVALVLSLIIIWMR